MYKQIAFLVFLLLLLLFFKFLFLYLFLSQLGYILPWSVSHQRVGLTLQQASDLLLLLLLFLLLSSFSRRETTRHQHIGFDGI